MRLFELPSHQQAAVEGLSPATRLPLDIAGQRRGIAAVRSTQPATAEAGPPAVPDGRRRAPRARLALVAGGSVPGPAPGEVAEARDRFLAQVARVLRPTSPPIPFAGAARRPRLVLLARIPRPLHADGGSRPDA